MTVMVVMEVVVKVRVIDVNDTDGYNHNGDRDADADSVGDADDCGEVVTVMITRAILVNNDNSEYCVTSYSFWDCALHALAQVPL